MRLKQPLLLSLVMALLGACATDPRNAHQMEFEEALNFEDRALARYLSANLELADLNDEEITVRLNQALNDVTTIVKQTGHGIYVEYTAPDGRLFMWYPNNFGVVAGTWGISDEFSPPRACFKYFNAAHGVTGEYEPNECVPTEQILGEAYVIDKRDGDVFELSSKGIPYSKSAGNLPPWPEDWAKFESQ
ncbi:MAG: hypothetical protein AAF465_17495 [Pseudomonadota bacterium]